MQPAHVWFPVSHQIQPSDETSLGCWIWQHSGFRLDNPCIVNLAIKFMNILQVTWLGFTWIDRKPVSIWIKNYCSIKLLKVYWGYKETFQKLWRNFMVFKKLSWTWNNVGCSRIYVVRKSAVPCAVNPLFNLTYPYTLNYELQVSGVTSFA